MNLELLGGATGRSFSAPSPRAEKGLGYDIAMVPALPAIWGLLGRGGRPPAGVPMGVASAGAVSASLFIQYKRCEELKRSTAREVKSRKLFYEDHEVPYFRYGLPEQQLDRLLQLSQKTGVGAEVCYAAPGFTTFEELHDAQMRGAVVQESDFLPLPEIDAFLSATPPGLPQEEHCWTFRAAGVDGCFCSEPGQLSSYGGGTLQRFLRQILFVEERKALVPHLFELEDAVAGWGSKSRKVPSERWIPRVEDRGRQRLLQAPPGVRAALNIQTIASRYQLGWNLVIGWPSDVENVRD